MPTVLGLPGNLAAATDNLQPSDWRIGGRLVVPSSLKPDELPWTCKVCSKTLALVAQVSEKGQACGRAFGLFGCTSEGCGRKAGSWRAFTFPFEVSVHRVKKPPLQAAGLSLPKVQNESIDWGVKDTLSWGDGDCQEQPWGEPELSSAENTETSHSRSLEGTTFAIPGTAPQEDGHSPAWPVGAVVSGDTLEYAKLLNQLDTALNLRQETCRKPQAQLPPMLPNGHDSEESCADCKQVSIASLALPEFFLWDMAEPATKESILSRKEQHHIAELLQKYQQEEVEPQVQEQQPEGPSSSAWQGEKYEKAALDAVDNAFLKFSKRLRRSPDQCLRFGGELLWPAKTLPPSASEICTRCGTELQFILQLTPALMHFIEEAVQWLEGSSAEDSPVPDWEWATVAVFGCRICMKASGNGKKLETGTSYEELSIAIFNE